MKQIIWILLLLTTCLCSGKAIAQKYLIVDKYGTKRIKLKEGDAIRFRQKNNPTWYKDVILELKDTSLVLQDAAMEIPVSDFSELRFPSTGSLLLMGSTGFMATGFLVSAAVHPLVKDAQYDQKESAIIGASFLGAGLIGSIFRWNKYKIGKRARVRIVDTTFKTMPTSENAPQP